MSNQNKTALVTGGAKRIGSSICIHLAEMGLDIAIHYHNSESAARKTAKLVKSKGRRCEIFRADLSRPANAAKLVEKASRKMGGLSVLVNNASVFRRSDFGKITERALEDDLAVNFKSPFFAAQAFARLTKKGLVVNIVDSRVTKNHTAHFAYNISKKCLYNFTFAAARSLAPGIRVNAICPGPIMKAAGTEEAAFEKIAREIPLKKGGDTQHINLALEYLVKNSFVTGEALLVDGGQHL
ncbi:MAG: SDR family oxidoreductase [Candidatus Mycalebacterium zealandia]|nr:MAG: SDR family oxidoreductase [Candidatus Mycalebacterium zealandia]